MPKRVGTVEGGERNAPRRGKKIGLREEGALAKKKGRRRKKGGDPLMEGKHPSREPRKVLTHLKEREIITLGGGKGKEDDARRAS